MASSTPGPSSGLQTMASARTSPPVVGALGRHPDRRHPILGDPGDVPARADGSVLVAMYGQAVVHQRINGDHETDQTRVDADRHELDEHPTAAMAMPRKTLAALRRRIS